MQITHSPKSRVPAKSAAKPRSFKHTKRITDLIGFRCYSGDIHGFQRPLSDGYTYEVVYAQLRKGRWHPLPSRSKKDRA